MRMNTRGKPTPVFTAEGGQGTRVSPDLTLRRMALTAMLFEKQFYQSGSEHSKTVIDTIAEMEQTFGTVEMIRRVLMLAVECREQMYLRHMPLFLLSALTRFTGSGTSVAIGLARCIQRPDEMGEFIAIYAKMFPEAIRSSIDYRTGLLSGARKGVKLSAGAKRGLAQAFRKFNPYQLAKYNRDAEYSLTDVIRLVKPKPGHAQQSQTWKSLIKKTLASPDTWEVALSAGKDKKATWERLIQEGRLGGLAFLRNLRNMQKDGVSLELIRQRFKEPFPKVLPYRFIAAAKYAPSLVAEVDEAMLRSTVSMTKLPGHTAIIVDVSRSMKDPMSSYSDMVRRDAASALSIILRELCNSTQVFTFSNHVVIIPSYRGMALSAAINDSQPHGGTELRAAMNAIGVEVRAGRVPAFDRVIVITDEQTRDGVGQAAGLGYMINVGANMIGVGYPDKGWVHIDGFSERIVDFIYNHEGIKANTQLVEED